MRETLHKLERKCAQFSSRNANRCYRTISVKYFLIKETSKGDCHGGADLAASSTEKLKIYSRVLSLYFLPRKKRRKVISACIIFNYAVGLLEIVIAFETTRTTGALLVGTRQNILEVPKEESDLAGSSRELLHRFFVVSKSRESYNEEIFASGVTGAASV